MIGVLPGLLPGVELADATLATGAARILKTPDEIACLRHSQHINEVAMYDVEAALRPGVRQNELSAIFLRGVFEQGASSSIIDPIWNITPLSVAAGTHTANDDVGLPAREQRPVPPRGRPHPVRHRHHVDGVPLRLRQDLDLQRRPEADARRSAPATRAGAR